MGKQRYRNLKYGYYMREGLIIPHPIESAIVRWIFERYIQGASYQKLAEWLSKDGICYQDSDTKWNKNIIKRILDSEDYYDSEKYPPIILKVQWHQVQFIKRQKAEKRAEKVEWPRSFRQKLICYQCGSRIYRGNQGKTENWQCRREGKLTSENLTDDVLWNKVIEKQKLLLEHSELLQMEKEKQEITSLQMIQKSNEIIKLIKLQETSEENILKMIFELTAEQYKSCSLIDNGYQTEKLRRLYRNHNIKVDSQPDFELLDKSVKKIYVESSGELFFELINGALV